MSAWGAEHRQRARILHLFGWWVAAVALFALCFYLPLPYYVTRPGSAMVLGPIVHVEGGTKDGKGAFMLTTVRMGEATPAWYVYARLSDEAELIHRQLILGHGETDEEFTERELAVMRHSQQVAEAVAFQRAGYPVKMEKQGVVVMGTIPGLPARDLFRVGDVITAVDGRRTSTTSDLLGYLETKRAGNVVEVTYLRDGRELRAQVTLTALPDEEGKPSERVGLGIRPEDKLAISVPRDVTITSQNIGGPSAGLMFSLEIYNQLQTDVDLTRGYQVAGTGTIDADGTVGRIGGIDHKVIAAHRAGADIFLAPEQGPSPSNYEEAVETAQRIGSGMRIVPVKTIDDAIRYLRSLPPKTP